MKFVLLDVKSMFMFMLLKRRFTYLKIDDPSVKARRKLMNYIINLSRHLGKFGILNFQLYFWGSAISMELDIIPLSYKEGTYEDVYQDIQHLAAEYSDAVVEKIEQLH